MTVSGVKTLLCRFARPLNNSQMRMLGYQENSAGQSNHDFQNSDEVVMDAVRC
jgi:hypothetical protein